MVVGISTIELTIPESNSLKDKRQIIRSMLDGVRRRFNVSAAEVDHLDLWRRATLGIAAVSNEQKFLDQVLDKVTHWIEENPRVNVVDVQVEFL
jgi:uncharacterized protein YlxP (DUF503 family)